MNGDTGPYLSAEDMATLRDEARAILEERRRIEGDPDHWRGLYSKFYADRTDPEARARHPDCFYFVLDVSHDKFAIAALRAYADACRIDFPALAADILMLIANSGGAQ